MIVETKEIYKCSHCRKLYHKKHLCVNHELVCNKNPVNYRPCIGCPLLSKKETSVFYDNPNGGEIERKVELLYCEFHKHFMYTPKTEIKKNAFELGDEFNEAMPKECDVDIDAHFRQFNF